MHIGLQIKLARIAKGLTQQDLAVRIFKTRPLVSHIEQKGEVNEKTLADIKKVLDMLEQNNGVNEPAEH
jgi:transcriptional regulator with XRE-family HTH domain